MAARHDPYETLGVSPTASDAEVRAAYRGLVQLHHPDHNGGSATSTRRFEEIQEAYAQVRQRRDGATEPKSGRTASTQPPRTSTQPPRTSTQPPRTSTQPPRTSTQPPRTSTHPPDSRLAAMEREIREAQRARERARQAAREAAAQGYRRPSDEELGYIETDDSLGKILSDARARASERLAEVREPVVKRVTDLLDELATRLNGDGPARPRE